MCTLLLAIGQRADAPLMVAANRDERLDRPVEPPSWWPSHPGSPRIWAPRDVLAGGTWIGLNSAGLLVAVTNRFGEPRDPARRSRGLVVAEALSYRSADEAADVISALEPLSVNPFHLVMADRSRAALVWHDGQRLRREALSAGLHIITERSLGAAEDGRAARLEPQLTALAGEDRLTLEAMGALLDQHEGCGLDDARVYVEEWGYGTRSRTLVSLSRAARETRFEHRELGPPARRV